MSLKFKTNDLFRVLKHFKSPNGCLVSQRNVCSAFGANLTRNEKEQLSRPRTISLAKLYLTPVTVCQNRKFWGVDVAFNKVNQERVRLAGPDRAAAEWVLRNAGTIKWTTSSNHLTDYNLLPTTQFDSYKLEEIDVSNTTIIGMGFEHLKDLHHVKKIRMHNCKSLGDDGLSHFIHVKDSLTAVEISSCPMITENGLNQLKELENLKHLTIYDLLEIRNLESVVAGLRHQMPNVEICTEDPFETEKKEQE